MSEYIYRSDGEPLANERGEISLALAGEIVRCRDCKHADEVTWLASSKVPPDYLDCNGPLVESWDYYNDEPKDNPVPPDGFCAWGERREGC